MPGPTERILVVENDPMMADLITRQVLIPQGYEVKLVADGGAALKAAKDFAPDVVIANLELPGLSGKDLIVGLNSQVLSFPIIMIAAQGKEQDVIQAFRLGATDYVGSPVREAELISAVERALEQVRMRMERRRLSMELQRTNKQLEKRVKELVTIFGVGKAVTSITSQEKLYKTIVEAAIKITESDIGWLLIQDEDSGEYILRSQMNLPASLVANLNKVWVDGLGKLVAKSGETFAIHGQAFEKFPVSAIGKSALVAPVKVNNQSIALLAVMRNKDIKFLAGDQAMLESICDYASISMVNARLFQALDERAENLQNAMKVSQTQESKKDEFIQHIGQGLHIPLTHIKKSIDEIISSENGNLGRKSMELLQTIQENTDQALGVTEEISQGEALSQPN